LHPAVERATKSAVVEACSVLRAEAVDGVDPDLVEAPAVLMWQPLVDYLEGRRVATITAYDLSVVSINDPALQHELHEEPAVRAVLDSPAARQALLPRRNSAVALDNAAVRLASDIDRYITQACALALFDRPKGPDVIHDRSRHDDTEGCWAIYNHAHVQVGRAEPLSPHRPDHAQALTSVATLWDLSLPPAWKQRMPGVSRMAEGLICAANRPAALHAAKVGRPGPVDRIRARVAGLR